MLAIHFEPYLSAPVKPGPLSLPTSVQKREKKIQRELETGDFVPCFYERKARREDWRDCRGGKGEGQSVGDGQTS